MHGAIIGLLIVSLASTSCSTASRDKSGADVTLYPSSAACSEIAKYTCCHGFDILYEPQCVDGKLACRKGAAYLQPLRDSEPYFSCSHVGSDAWVHENDLQN